MRGTVPNTIVPNTILLEQEDCPLGIVGFPRDDIVAAFDNRDVVDRSSSLEKRLAGGDTAHRCDLGEIIQRHGQEIESRAAELAVHAIEPRFRRHGLKEENQAVEVVCPRDG